MDMSDRLKELREKRLRIVEEMRAITEKATAEKRDLTAEEVAQHDKLFAEQSNVQGEMRAIERNAEIDREAAEAAGKAEERARAARAKGEPVREINTDEYRAAFGKFIARGRDGIGADERRALASGTGSEGGFLLAPEQFTDSFIKFVDDLVYIRQLATKFRVAGAHSLGVASLDADPADADWTTELATGSEDSTMAFGKRQMAPNPLAKRIKVSNDLLRRVPGVETMVRERLAYKFGITEEKAFMTGSGSGQPLGIFTASADGIPTSRDVSTGNTTSALTFNGLTNALYALKAPYRKSAAARWLFSREAIRRISLLRDESGASADTGQYLWQPSRQAGEPDRILGVEFIESEYVPATFTSGLYVGAVGDFSNYWIADTLDMELKRLDELYAETNQTGFIGRHFVDGQPVLAEAFVRVQLA